MIGSKRWHTNKDSSPKQQTNSDLFDRVGNGWSKFISVDFYVQILVHLIYTLPALRENGAQNLLLPTQKFREIHTIFRLFQFDSNSTSSLLFCVMQIECDFMHHTNHSFVLSIFILTVFSSTFQISNSKMEFFWFKFLFWRFQAVSGGFRRFLQIQKIILAVSSTFQMEFSKTE